MSTTSFNETEIRLLSQSILLSNVPIEQNSSYSNSNYNMDNYKGQKNHRSVNSNNSNNQSKKINKWFIHY